MSAEGDAIFDESVSTKADTQITLAAREADNSHAPAQSNSGDSAENASASRSPFKRLIANIVQKSVRLRSSRFASWAIRIWKTLCGLWSRRPKFSLLVYGIVFLGLTSGAVLFLQWSMYQEPNYPPDTVVDEQTRAANSVAGRLTSFVSQIWLHRQYQFILNFLLLALIYAIIILIINRFWLASGIFGTLVTIAAVANKSKMLARNEPIIPADLSFLMSGNAGEVVSFIPTESAAFVQQTIYCLIWLSVICLVLYVLDRRKAVIPSAWKPSRFTTGLIIGTVTRVLAIVTSIGLIVSFAWNLSNVGSWANRVATKLSDFPILWTTRADAETNGPLVSFLRLSHVTIMDKPDEYNQQTMERLAAKYRGIAADINTTRNRNLTDNTVIMVLSETFSDPTRIPGVSLAHDPMPNIRAIENTTTSGLALSTGYGGGTANLEYQSLTGLSMASFNPSLATAYQQLTPNQKKVFTFNQLWNSPGDNSASVAIHPYSHTAYLRANNYKKFQFSKFYTTDGENQISCPSIDNSTYASDQCAYQNALDVVRDGSSTQFVQLITMQNHMPYANWYNDNEFAQAEVPASDRYNNDTLATYAKGVEYTDTFTADFLDQLNSIDKPITVIFYGDHLPGIYNPVNGSEEPDPLTLHETDYFIWSNAATYASEPLPAAQTGQFTSSNYFMAQTTEHLGARVSPYLAFLEQMHEAVPAISVPMNAIPNVATADDSNSPTYLNADGTIASAGELSDGTLELLEDYKLIQYDQTAGKHYLDDTDFMKLQ
ncbi:LTA synthase family protein [Bifidobacterium tsurumiense]|uniref:Phosphoglycerol transferase n=1 Tax=Bifidobacterium tsurumiense TaxID=356829 RepID=A0A087EI31_9BIFI|nr:LTA synthase family protein [Bifidobacterium tsurumiense]KFJ07432.1 phosphoglycerol transferase [Bifidobacterium tsurumiense]